MMHTLLNNRIGCDLRLISFSAFITRKSEESDQSELLHVSKAILSAFNIFTFRRNKDYSHRAQSSAVRNIIK